MKAENVNQYVFMAITGYEGPTAAFSSASVDDWSEMSDVELREQVEAQAELAVEICGDRLEEAEVSGNLDVEAVVEVLRSYAEGDFDLQGTDEVYSLFTKLSNDNLEQQDNNSNCPTM